MMSDLPHWPHQLEALHRMEGKPAFYLSAEMRTGKTRPIIEEVAKEYKAGTINTLLLIAMPSGAPRNWTDDELPLWLPPDIQHTTILWRANKANSTSFQRSLKDALTCKHLFILAVNGEAIITDTFRKFGAKLLKARKLYVCADEASQIMKTPPGKKTGKRSKVMHYIARHPNTIIRRCLDGTPMETPMDLYSQYAFLDPAILDAHSFFAFKTHYAVLEKGFNHNTNREYTAIAKNEEGEPQFQNLDELQARIEPYTFRVRFNDVFKDNPIQIFQKHYFQLLPDQKKAYDRLQEEYEIELQALGTTVTAAHVLTRYLRLQQVASGYWPPQKNQPSICPACDGDGCEACDGLGVKPITIPLQRLVSFKDNPRIEALRKELLSAPGQVIVWARFDQDIDDCITLSKELGRTQVQYDGRLNESEKAAAKNTFQAGKADDFIAKTTAAGRALRVDKAQTQIYYSNNWSLLQRLQSQMRTEVGGRTHATQIIDLVAEDTLDDTLIIPALRGKKRIADIVMKEHRKDKWL